MWGSCWGDRINAVKPERLKNSMDISSERHCGNCMILYLFHLIFKILFFFQFLYILTLKIIIDMQSVWSDFICDSRKQTASGIHTVTATHGTLTYSSFLLCLVSLFFVIANKSLSCTIPSRSTSIFSLCRSIY